MKLTNRTPRLRTPAYDYHNGKPQRIDPGIDITEGLILNGTTSLIEIDGVPVRIVNLAPGKWGAEWTGSDRRKVQIVRGSRAAVIEQIKPTMALRAKVFGVEF